MNKELGIWNTEFGKTRRRVHAPCPMLAPRSLGEVGPHARERGFTPHLSTIGPAGPPLRPSVAWPKGAGFTLIELLVGVSVFAIMAVAIYRGYVGAYEVGRLSRLKIAALALGNEQLEIIRNLPYADVGIVNGLPPGKIPREQTLTRGATRLRVVTTVRSIDDPFDGTVSGTPRDLSPADYKLAELTISCPSCQRFAPFSLTAHVAPRNLESATGNGALFVQVLDANGQPVQGADVHIENNQATPRIVIDETTNNDGMLQIVDAPPGIEAYEVTVTKSGYSTERTYPTGAAGNPNPTKPHATVVVGEVTQVTFAIDRVSTLNVATVTNTCSPVDSVDFTLRGAKLIGTNPDVPKYEASHTTDVRGEKAITNLEWDTYMVTLTSATYDLIGSVPLLPVNLSPNTTQDLKLIVAPKDPRSLLVTVKDAGTQLPVSGATVAISGTGYTNTLTTGEGALRQTDWSGGPGQADFIDPTRYWEANGAIESGVPAGELKLRNDAGQYQASGWLQSSAFDTGADTDTDYHEIQWQPQDQPPEVGPDGLRFQIASKKNRTQGQWTFQGPTGAQSYYTLADRNIHARHDGDRYFRYRVFLQTANTQFTPNLAEVSFTFTSSCIPPGQVLFSGLAAQDYALTVSRAGYQTFTDTVSVAASWQAKDVLFSPQ